MAKLSPFGGSVGAGGAGPLRWLLAGFPGRRWLQLRTPLRKGVLQRLAGPSLVRAVPRRRLVVLGGDRLLLLGGEPAGVEEARQDLDAGGGAHDRGQQVVESERGPPPAGGLSLGSGQQLLQVRQHRRDAPPGRLRRRGLLSGTSLEQPLDLRSCLLER